MTAIRNSGAMCPHLVQGEGVLHQPARVSPVDAENVVGQVAASHACCRQVRTNSGRR